MPVSAARCVIADDHPAVVSLLSDYLSVEDVEIVAVAADGPRAVAAVREAQPAVVITDYRMPHLEGPQLLRALEKACPTARILVYTGEADAGLCDEALGAGAAGLVLKEAPLVDLRRAIRAVCAGETYVDPALAGTQLTGGKAPRGLTPRERDVLTLLADGHSHDAISERLSISTETVRTHVRKACLRMDAATRTQAVAEALRRGLI